VARPTVDTALLTQADECQDGTMATTTVRIPEDKRDTLKTIASVEKRDIKDILSELIDEYIQRHEETIEILSQPDWMEAINQGLASSAKGETVAWRMKKAGK
jgi:predicted transcriptional regulator